MAWNSISKDTINNCWNCLALEEKPAEESEPLTSETTLKILTRDINPEDLKFVGEIIGESDVRENNLYCWADVDNNEPAFQTLTDAAIVEIILHPSVKVTFAENEEDE